MAKTIRPSRNSLLGKHCVLVNRHTILILSLDIPVPNGNKNLKISENREDTSLSYGIYSLNIFYLVVPKQFISNGHGTFTP